MPLDERGGVSTAACLVVVRRRSAERAGEVAAERTGEVVGEAPTRSSQMLTRFRTLSRLRGEKARLALSSSAGEGVTLLGSLTLIASVLVGSVCGCGNDKPTTSPTNVLP